MIAEISQKGKKWEKRGINLTRNRGKNKPWLPPCLMTTEIAEASLQGTSLESKLGLNPRNPIAKMNRWGNF